jgi:hypothetical protein
MDTYLCSYFLRDEGKFALYFRCQADDIEHALEQLYDAEPQALQPYCEIYSRSNG